MPRPYTCPFKFVTVSAAQDLISMKGSSGKTCDLLRLWVFMNDTTLQTAQGLRLNVKYASATLTLGSVGAAVTPTPVDPGDAAASFTARRNDTTPATTSGAFTDITPAGGHNYAGWDWTFKSPPTFGLNEGIVFELNSTVSGTCNFSGGSEVLERGS